MLFLKMSMLVLLFIDDYFIIYIHLLFQFQNIANPKQYLVCYTVNYPFYLPLQKDKFCFQTSAPLTEICYVTNSVAS